MPLDGSGVYSLPAGNPMPFKLKPLPSSLLNSTFSDLKDALNSRLWKGGGTMTGALTLAGNPSGALDAAPKQYVDLHLPKAGGTMTGALTLAGNPSGALDAAPKQYVDLHLPKAGGTLTGALSGTTAAFSGTVSGATATAAGHLVTKAQLDAVAATAGVASFNTRTGAVTLSSSDVTTALGFTPVTNARSITAGTGLTGGGDLTANRSFAFDTTWGDARYAQLASPNFSGTPQVSGNNIWHAGNFNPASYAPLSGATFTGDITTHRGNATGVIFLGNTGARYLHYNGTNYEMPGAQLLINGSQAWHAGNDGAGSGLDADLLDGQQGSFYQDASNLTAGTVPSARMNGAYPGITSIGGGVNWALNTQGGSYTLQASDKHKLVFSNNVGPGSVWTIPSGVFASGDDVLLINDGTNTVSIAAGSGLTLRSSLGTGNRTLGAGGSIAVVYFQSASVAYLQPILGVT